MSIVAKAVYSVFLLGLSWVLLRELWMVWFDRTIYVGQFDVISETGRDDAASTAFPKRIVGAQAILARQLSDYQTRRAVDAPSDATFILPGMTPLLLPPEALSGIDITVQSVNVTQLLTAIRKTFLAPNEVVGNVAKRDGSVLAAVDWPRAPRLGGEPQTLTNFLVPSQSTEQAAAAHIACSLSWARATERDPNVGRYPRAQFCDFGVALSDLYSLGEKAADGSALAPADTALIRKRLKQLRTHHSASAVLPEIYRLCADLVDLLPEAERKQSELVEAQEDRVRYAMLSPELSKLPDAEKRFAALAIARPAIIVEAGKLVKPPENWVNLLRARETELLAGANAVGLIRRGNGEFIGTGCIIAPHLMMTARFVLQSAGYDFKSSGPTQQILITKRPSVPLQLCFGSSVSACGESLEIGDVVYVNLDVSSPIALVSVEQHVSVDNPPLSLAEEVAAPTTLIGQYAAVIGYPSTDFRMPPEFTNWLLAEKSGYKRLMPGRILAFGAEGVPASFFESSQTRIAVFTTDISTSGGTAGGPLIELNTGRVIGMSYAGVWKGERGKFAYAAPIPPEARDIIARRTRGETIVPLADAPAVAPMPPNAN